jgi:hypothetical protein
LNIINLPKNVSFVGIAAFSGCINLKQLFLHREKPFLLLQDVFKGVSLSSCIVYVPVGSLSRYLSKPAWKQIPNIGEQTGDIEEKEGIVQYFGQSIPVTSTNAFSVVYQLVKKSDVGVYSGHRALDCFFILAAGVSEDCKELALENALLLSDKNDWDHLTLDSTFQYFKRLYPNNPNLSVIEKSINRLKSIHVGQRIPSFAFKTLDGIQDRSTDALIGKPTLFLFLDLDKLTYPVDKITIKEVLEKITNLKNEVLYKDIQFALLLGSQNREKWTSLAVDPEAQNWMYWTSDPASMYAYFDRDESLGYLLLDKKGLIACNDLQLELDTTNSLESIKYRIHLLKLQDYEYQPAENPEAFARDVFSMFLKGEISPAAFLPAAVLNELNEQGFLRMHHFRSIIYAEGYFRTVEYFVKLLNVFEGKKVVINKINYRSERKDNIIDKIQIVFTVDDNETYQFILQNCLNFQGQWYIFHDYFTCKNYNPKQITRISTMPIWTK